MYLSSFTSTENSLEQEFRAFERKPWFENSIKAYVRVYGHLYFTCVKSISSIDFLGSCDLRMILQFDSCSIAKLTFYSKKTECT